MRFTEVILQIILLFEICILAILLNLEGRKSISWLVNLISTETSSNIISLVNTVLILSILESIWKWKIDLSLHLTVIVTFLFWCIRKIGQILMYISEERLNMIALKKQIDNQSAFVQEMLNNKELTKSKKHSSDNVIENVRNRKCSDMKIRNIQSADGLGIENGSSQVKEYRRENESTDKVKGQGTIDFKGKDLRKGQSEEKGNEFIEPDNSQCGLFQTDDVKNNHYQPTRIKSSDSGLNLAVTNPRNLKIGELQSRNLEISPTTIPTVGNADSRSVNNSETNLNTILTADNDTKKEENTRPITHLNQMSTQEKIKAGNYVSGPSHCDYNAQFSHKNEIKDNKNPKNIIYNDRSEQNNHKTSEVKPLDQLQLNEAQTAKESQFFEKISIKMGTQYLRTSQFQNKMPEMYGQNPKTPQSVAEDPLDKDWTDNWDDTSSSTTYQKSHLVSEETTSIENDTQLSNSSQNEDSQSISQKNKEGLKLNFQELNKEKKQEEWDDNW